MVEVVREKGLVASKGYSINISPGSTLTRRALQPCLVTSFKVVWKDQWPSGAYQCTVDLHLLGREI